MPEVIVIGSGLGGLTCACILLKNGYKVAVLEQGLQIGGCLQCFTRKGVKFETGMHFIGSAAPGQTMDRVMKYFGLGGKVRLSPLDTDGYNTIGIDGGQFRFANGNEAFIEQMAGYFPAEKDALARYVDIINRISSASTLSSLTSDRRDMAANTEYSTCSINNVLDSLFKDSLLKKVLIAAVVCCRTGQDAIFPACIHYGFLQSERIPDSGRKRLHGNRPRRQHQEYGRTDIHRKESGENSLQRQQGNRC